MINLARDVRSLTDFKRNTNDYVEQIKQTKSPVVLTVNGKAELIVQDVESYQELLTALDRAEAIAGIRRGLDQMERGEGVPASEAFAQIRERLKSPVG